MDGQHIIDSARAKTKIISIRPRLKYELVHNGLFNGWVDYNNFLTGTITRN